MATHFSILAWKTPLTEEPGGLWSMRVSKSWTELSMHRHTDTQTDTHTHTQSVGIIPAPEGNQIMQSF